VLYGIRLMSRTGAAPEVNENAVLVLVKVATIAGVLPGRQPRAGPKLVCVCLVILS
jgi:hypothetical protein